MEIVNSGIIGLLLGVLQTTENQELIKLIKSVISQLNDVLISFIKSFE